MNVYFRSLYLNLPFFRIGYRHRPFDLKVIFRGVLVPCGVDGFDVLKDSLGASSPKKQMKKRHEKRTFPNKKFRESFKWHIPEQHEVHLKILYFEMCLTCPRKLRTGSTENQPRNERENRI